MNEQLEVPRIAVERLSRAGMPYMVTGSMALNQYAVPRMTRDIDIVVDVGVADADRVCSLFADDFYVDRDAARSAMETAGMFNLIHMTLVMKLDIVVRKDTEFRRRT